MRGKFNLEELVWNKLLGPHHPRLFRFRIWLRVRWLLTKLWRNKDVSLRAILQALPRPFFVALIGLGVPLLTLWVTGNLDLLDYVGKRASETANTPMEWRALIQLVLLFIGLPAAFVIWAFRDHNVQATLENQRKDVNLKAFQEIQLRASGALDEKLPEEAREQLQITSLHQLRPFLQGKFGPDFQGPAVELLLAGQHAALSRLDLERPNGKWVNFSIPDDKVSEKIRERVRRSHFKNLQPDWVRKKIIQEEWFVIFRKLTDGHLRSLDQIDLQSKILSEIDMNASLLRGAQFGGAHLEYARLRVARLDGAYLGGAHCQYADLSLAYLDGAIAPNSHFEYALFDEAHLEGTELHRAKLFGAKLRGSKLCGADLTFADIRGADFSGADLNHALLDGALYDDDTILDWNWSQMPEMERGQKREVLAARGARHVKTLSSDSWQYYL